MKQFIIFSKIFMIFAFCLFVSNVYAYSLNITQQTQADQENIFYISKNASKEIFFNINTSYKKQGLNQMQEPYITVDLDSLDSSSNISFTTSNNKLFFRENPNISFSLTANPNNYQNKTTRVVLTFSLFDEFDNLLDIQKKYFYFKANNEEIDYLTKTGRKPRFLGYTLSDRVIEFTDINQVFIVDVDFLIDSYEYDHYSLVCETSENLKTKITRGVEGKNKLHVSLDKQEQFTEKHIINCFAKDKYESYHLKPISVFIFLDNVFEDEVSEDPNDSFLNISGFFSLGNLSDIGQLNLKTILIVIIVIMMFVVLLSKK